MKKALLADSKAPTPPKPPSGILRSQSSQGPLATTYRVGKKNVQEPQPHTGATTEIAVLRQEAWETPNSYILTPLPQMRGQK